MNSRPHPLVLAATTAAQAQEMFMDSLTTESLELAVMAAKVHFAAAQEHTTHLEGVLARRKEKAEVAR